MQTTVYPINTFNNNYHILLCSAQFSHSVESDSLQPHGLQHARLPYPSPTPGVYSNSCPLSWWCHSAISSSVVHFSSRLQSFPALGSFPMSQLFTSGGQSFVVSASASVLPRNIQDWFPLGWTGWISLESMGFSRVFSNSTVEKTSIIQCSAFLMVHLSRPYMSTGKDHIFNYFAGKVMSLLCNMLSRLVIISHFHFSIETPLERGKSAFY